MKKLDIIYEDKEIIAINKPSGLLTIATNKRESNTLYSQVSDYLKKQHPKNKVFIVHRLDKNTSGVILFAKNEKIKKIFQDNWNNICEEREYLAIVENKPSKNKERLINYLKETKTLYTFCTNDSKSGKLAITNYEIIKSNNKYTSLRVNIETGRKNQIRAQLANIGCPIIGDKKYEAKTNPLKRLGLHAIKLVIRHPISNQLMKFEAIPPNVFKSYL